MNAAIALEQEQERLEDAAFFIVDAVSELIDNMSSFHNIPREDVCRIINDATI